MQFPALARHASQLPGGLQHVYPRATSAPRHRTFRKASARRATRLKTTCATSSAAWASPIRRWAVPRTRPEYRATRMTNARSSRRCGEGRVAIRHRSVRRPSPRLLRQSGSSQNSSRRPGFVTGNVGLGSWPGTARDATWRRRPQPVGLCGIDRDAGVPPARTPAILAGQQFEKWAIRARRPKYAQARRLRHVIRRPYGRERSAQTKKSDRLGPADEPCMTRTATLRELVQDRDAAAPLLLHSRDGFGGGRVAVSSTFWAGAASPWREPSRTGPGRRASP